MYPEPLVAPMRQDLTVAGFKELKTSEEVDKELKDHKGTTLLVINSVCGCAAGAARPHLGARRERADTQWLGGRPGLLARAAGLDHRDQRGPAHRGGLGPLEQVRLLRR